MGTVYRKTVTKRLPAGAEIIEQKGRQVVRWIDSCGKRRTGDVTQGRDGSQRLLITARTFTAKYRDGSGIIREVATGCRDETAARRVLADLERRAELVKANVLTAAENSVADHQTVPLADHIDAYLTKLESDGTTAGHRANVRRCLFRVAQDAGIHRLNDLTREALERWLTQQTRAGMGARTRNLHRAAVVAFGNWCVSTDRMVSNPLAKVGKADESADRRHVRRALSEDELTRLLWAARYRPLAEYGRETVKKPAGEVTGRRTWRKRPLTIDTMAAALERGRHSLRNNPELVAELETIGRERALIYKTLVLTGLRKGELESITVGQVDLSGPVAYIALKAADEKNRQGNEIPLRSDLAAEIDSWTAERLDALRGESRSRGESIPARLPADLPLFRVPRDLVKILRRDMALAGIPKIDERGRIVDVHAMRHSFGTLLSKAGVSPRTAQAAMRHSSIDLTMNTYTDPKLLDVGGAIEALPELPLNGSHDTELEAATGTDDAVSRFAPGFAPTTDKRCLSGQKLTIRRDDCSADGDENPLAVSACQSKRKQPLPLADNGCRNERAKGFEPSTYSLGSNDDRVVSDTSKELATTAAPVCTRVCTSEAETDGGGDIERLADELKAGLSAADIERLVALLQGTSAE